MNCPNCSPVLLFLLSLLLLLLLLLLCITVMFGARVTNTAQQNW